VDGPARRAKPDLGGHPDVRRAKPDLGGHPDVRRAKDLPTTRDRQRRRARHRRRHAVARDEGTDEPNAGDAGGYLTSRVHRVGGARTRATPSSVSLEDTGLSRVFIATKDAVE
jgi:hypothetical protein